MGGPELPTRTVPSQVAIEERFLRCASRRVRTEANAKKRRRLAPVGMTGTNRVRGLHRGRDREMKPADARADSGNKRGGLGVITVSSGAYPSRAPASNLVVLCWLIGGLFVYEMAESS